MPAIGSPERMPGIGKRWLNPPGLATFRGHNEHLSRPGRDIHIVSSAESEKSDPLTVGREPGLPSVFRDELRRAACGGGLNVNPAAIALGPVGDQPRIRRE